jgi:1,4-alpha-glucan branching enzyme
MPGDPWNKAANVRALLAFMWAHPGKQLIFQGSEFGQEREWSEARSLDWHLLEEPLHAGIKSLVGDLNRAYRAHSALWTKDTTPEGFSWIDANDSSGNVLSFLRHGVDPNGKPTVMACIANFSGSPKRDYRVGLPFAGRWREVLNTDAQIYGGSGVGNLGAVEAEQTVWHGRPASAVLQLPPSGVLWLAPEPFEGAVRRREAAGTAAVPQAPADASAAEPEIDEPVVDEEAVIDQAPSAPVTDDAPVLAPAEPEAVELVDGEPVVVEETVELRSPATPADAAEPEAAGQAPAGSDDRQATTAEPDVEDASPSVTEDPLGGGAGDSRADDNRTAQ